MLDIYLFTTVVEDYKNTVRVSSTKIEQSVYVIPYVGILQWLSS